MMYIHGFVDLTLEVQVTQMIRKQIYMAPSHQALLRRLARVRGVSEAEVVRQAIEREATGGQASAFVHDPKALGEIIAYAMGRRQHGSATEPYHWDRDEVYTERFVRFGNG